MPIAKIKKAISDSIAESGKKVSINKVIAVKAKVISLS